jgi:hypothetical protein
VVQGKGSQKHRSMFNIFIAYLARNLIWQNLPVIIAILANFCTHIKHWYAPSESNIDFFPAEIELFCTQKNEKKEKKHGQGNVLENFQKNCHILRKKRFLIHQDFWRIWADFVAFFY